MNVGAMLVNDEQLPPDYLSKERDGYHDPRSPCIDTSSYR